MTDLPEPMTPADVDIRGLSSFMLDVDRLLASELVALATPEECWCAVMLWCRAWQQHPAGSLPNDERVLAAFSRAGPRWKKVKEMALRGFVLCSDGRLYHPVMVERAVKAWSSNRCLSSRINRRLEIASAEWSALRREVFERDDFTCQYCGDRGGRLECDHVVPTSRGGQTERANLATACFPCNRSKGSRTLEEWRGTTTISGVGA